MQARQVNRFVRSVLGLLFAVRCHQMCLCVRPNQNISLYLVDYMAAAYERRRRPNRHCKRHNWFVLTRHHWGETWCANVHVRASKMEGRKSGAQTRWHFSHLTLIFRLEIYVQESSCLEWIHAISNFTGSVLYCCWAACEIWRKMRERTCYDALTYIASKQRIRERTLRCANERFLVPTMNIDYLLHSVTIYKSLQYRNMFQSMHCIRLTLKRPCSKH